MDSDSTCGASREPPKKNLKKPEVKNKNMPANHSNSGHAGVISNLRREAGNGKQARRRANHKAPSTARNG